MTHLNMKKVSPKLVNTMLVINTMLAKIHPALCLSGFSASDDNPLQKLYRLFHFNYVPKTGFQITISALHIGIQKNRLYDCKYDLDSDMSIIDIRLLSRIQHWKFFLDDKDWYKCISDDGNSPRQEVLDMIAWVHNEYVLDLERKTKLKEI